LINELYWVTHILNYLSLLIYIYVRMTLIYNCLWGAVERRNLGRLQILDECWDLNHFTLDFNMMPISPTSQ